MSAFHTPSLTGATHVDDRLFGSDRLWLSCLESPCEFDEADDGLSCSFDGRADEALNPVDHNGDDEGLEKEVDLDRDGSDGVDLGRHGITSLLLL